MIRGGLFGFLVLIAGLKVGERCGIAASFFGFGSLPPIRVCVLTQLYENAYKFALCANAYQAEFRCEILFEAQEWRAL